MHVSPGVVKEYEIVPLSASTVPPQVSSGANFLSWFGDKDATCTASRAEIRNNGMNFILGDLIVSLLVC